MKTYTVEIKPVWCQEIEAKNKKQAIELLQNQYQDDFNFCPDTDEIIFLEIK